MRKYLLISLCMLFFSCSRDNETIVEVVKEKEVVIEKTTNLFEKMEVYCKNNPQSFSGNSDNVAKIMSEKVISVLNENEFDMVGIYVGEWNAVNRNGHNKTGNKLNKPIVFMKNFKIKEVRFYSYGDGYNEISYLRLTGDDIKPLDSFFNNYLVGIASKEDVLKMNVK